MQRLAAILNAIAMQYLDRSGYDLEKNELVNSSRRTVLARDVRDPRFQRAARPSFRRARDTPTVPFDDVKLGPDITAPESGEFFVIRHAEPGFGCAPLKLRTVFVALKADNGCPECIWQRGRLD
jgi:hypothetical protein